MPYIIVIHSKYKREGLTRLKNKSVAGAYTSHTNPGGVVRADQYMCIPCGKAILLVTWIWNLNLDLKRTFGKKINLGHNFLT